MGIRINKMLGYGLTDVVPEDPRINWNSPFLRWELHGEEHLNGYLALCNERQDLCLDSAFINQMRRNGDELPNIQDCFAMGHEDEGLPNVLCLRPVTETAWSRYGDPIDWAEAVYVQGTGESLDGAVVPLKNGVFPFSDLYMDTRTGERVSGNVHYWRNAAYNDDPKIREDSEILNSLAGLFEMSHDDALRFLAPAVPMEIRVLAEYGELFTGKDAWKELRPMIYTWWE